ncbi:MAG: ABC transporter substrate-binding protein [Acetobacteraceae bacterium]
MLRRLFNTCLAMALAVAALGASPAHAQMSGKYFTILIVTDMSSIYAGNSGPGTVAAVKMAIKDFGGTVNGVPIRLLVLDNKLNPTLTLNKTRQLIQQDHVNLITDVTSSAAAIEVAKLASEYKVTTTFVSPGSTVLTNSMCSRYTWHYAWDTYALAEIAGGAITKLGAKRWYFIAADYAYGHDLYNQFKKAVTDAGGTVTGVSFAPFPNSDFSTYLLKAKSTRPDAIGLLESGQDVVNAMKQAREFGLAGKVRLVPGQINLSDVRDAGVEAYQGVTAADIWYWNMDPRARAWADRFKAVTGYRPGSLHAANYSAVTQILDTVKRIGTDNPDKIADALEGHSFDDMFARHATWRAKDHSVIHDLILEAVKKPDQIKIPEDYFKVIRIVPGKDAFMPLSENTCKHDW